MRLSKFERQARRRSIYYVVGFLGILVVGTVLVVSILAATNQRLHTHLYRDPEQTLQLVFAQTETKWRYVTHHDKFATMQELVDGGQISEEFLVGPVEGLRYRVTVATVSSFVVTAEPEGPAASPEPPDPHNPRAPVPVLRPRLHYFVDETHVIRADDKAPATNKSTVIWSPRDLR